MRDAQSVLDQAISMSDGKVNIEDITDMLGLVTNENLLKLMDSIIDKSVESSIRAIDDIVLSGKDIYTFIKDMITHMRNLMIVKVSDNPEEVLDMSLENIDILKEQAAKIRVEEIMRYIRILQEAEEQSKWSKQSRIYLELAIIKMIKVEYDTSKEIMLARINNIEKAIKDGNIFVNHTKEEESENSLRINRTVRQGKQTSKEFNSIAKKEESTHTESIENEYSTLTLEKVKKSWKDILDLFKARRQMILYASLMTGKVVGCSNGVIHIQYEAQFAFNKERLEKEPNRKNAEEIFSEALKEKVRIKYSVEKNEENAVGPEEILRETFGEQNVEVIE